jgi:hypothetical protein
MSCHYRRWRQSQEDSLVTVWSAPALVCQHTFHKSENRAILITTRMKSVATKLVEPRDMIVVNPMTDRDAIALEEEAGQVDE